MSDPADESDPSEDEAARRTRLVRAVMGQRREGGDATRFTATTDEDTVTVEYTDRLVRLDVDETERAALDALLADYSVFKVKQPETRKAPDGVVYVSAIADPKHVADFVAALFREVYGLPEGYRLACRRE